MSESSVVLSSADSSAAGAQLKFDTLLTVCAKLSEPRPVEELLHELLLQARRMARAEAGTVFIVEEERLRFVCCQNDARPDLCVAPRRTDPTVSAGLKGVTLPMDHSSLAGYSARSGEALKIDDAYALAANTPFRFDRKYDESTGYRTRSLLVIPLLERSGQAVGVMQLINHLGKDGSFHAFSSRDQQIGLALASMAAISVRNAKLRDALQKSHLDTIMRLSTAAEFRDDDTGEHIKRVSLYCETLARRMGMAPQLLQLMLFASPMHDIGKLGVPDAILSKPGQLTPEERKIMQTHTLIGARILQQGGNELLAIAEKIARSHHERWDGTGYPDGLAGEAIPIEGRITAVADVFDALTSARVYKPAFEIDHAAGIIVDQRGRHFDPTLVDAFVMARDEIEAIYDAYRPTPEESHHDDLV